MGEPKTNEEERSRLQRCIRDLAALNALPSMCVGRSPDEALTIVLDALPTALACNLVGITTTGSPRRCGGSLDGQPLTPEEIDQLADSTFADGSEAVTWCRDRKLYCLQVDVPIGSERVRLVAGRVTPLDPETDRVLFRSAANLVGALLASANVLEGAQRKDDFIAMLGHELRNPLASILVAAELLGQKVGVGREQRVIESHTRHLSRLVDDLLDVGRIARGQLELRNDHISLSFVLERAAEIAEPLLRQHRHALQIDNEHDVTLIGDAVRLAQVFGNLLTNAAKFTPDGGHIRVSVQRLEGRVRVRVKDDGRGLQADHIQRIFEPFIQVDRNHAAPSNGLGLGLAIVDSLVRRHGGSVVAESQGIGHGSTFSVELPTVNALPEQPLVPSHPTKRTVIALRVLIVDDNTDMAELLCEGLALEGFVTVAEHDAASALERWRAFRPHVAILDVGLPDMDGYALARALRTEHGTDAMIIAATGYGQATDRRRATEAGFDRHFVKPVSASELVRAIDERFAGRAPRGVAGTAASDERDVR